VLCPIAQKENPEIEGEPSDIRFRIASKVNFFETRAERRITHQVCFALGHHVGKLDVPRRRIFPDSVVVYPEILKRSATIQRQITNGVFPPRKRPTLID
jgi:hypothetical protein